MKTALSQRLVYLRKERGFTQKRAAESLGISQALLSHYEKGIRECGLGFLCSCADFYGVTTDYLLGRSCEKEAPKKETLYDPEKSEGCAMRARLIRATGMLFDLYHKLGSPELMEIFSLYMSVPVYIMTRHLYESGSNVPGFFSLPDDYFPYSPVSAQLIAEMRVRKLLSEIDARRTAPEGADALPKIDYTALSEMFPREYTALLQVLHSVDRSSMSPDGPDKKAE
ncbi:MAG: helix-turn-helix transcriptional regulator [Clostridia bacterium]|nr:helix-turn-helix transcriptional regulator [Clostridia bacterium]